ncbi:MAG: peptidyl-prolyl cis-trans isomerase [Planctomycetes bacterium]|nr:peptidyl-prolyl cis-trans isomerase [Planctomycetota bacterium]
MGHRTTIFAATLLAAAILAAGCGSDPVVSGEGEGAIRLPLGDTERPVLSDTSPGTPYTAETAQELDVAGAPGIPTARPATATATQKDEGPRPLRYKADLNKILAGGESRTDEESPDDEQPAELTTAEEGRQLKIVNLIVAEVNDEIITREDLLKPLRPSMAHWVRTMDEREFEARVRVEVMTRLRAEISRRLALQEARKQATEQHTQYFEREIEKERKRQIAMVGNQLEWQKQLAAMGTTEEQWKKDELERMLVQYFLNEAVGPKISVTRQELLDYYERVRKERYEPKTQAHMQLIRLRRADFPNEEAVLSLATSLVKRARGGEDFAALARQYSSGSHAQDGGLWPPLQQGSYREDAVDKALFAEPVGSVCDPIVCPRDVYVLKVLQRTEARTIPFTEVQDEVDKAVRDEKFAEMVDQYIRGLYQKSYVKIHEANL